MFPILSKRPEWCIELTDAAIVWLAPLPGGVFALDEHGRAWHLSADGKVRWKVESPPGGALAPLPDGLHVLAFTREGRVQRIEAATGRATDAGELDRRLSGVRSATPSPDGRYVYVDAAELVVEFHHIYGDHDHEQDVQLMWNTVERCEAWALNSTRQKMRPIFTPDGEGMLLPPSVLGTGMAWVEPSSGTRLTPCTNHRYFERMLVLPDKSRALHLAQDGEALAVTRITDRWTRENKQDPAETVLTTPGQPAWPLALLSKGERVLTWEGDRLGVRGTWHGDLLDRGTPLPATFIPNQAIVAADEGVYVASTQGQLARLDTSHRLAPTIACREQRTHLEPDLGGG